jgi:hypothetical protein
MMEKLEAVKARQSDEKQNKEEKKMVQIFIRL